MNKMSIIYIVVSMFLTCFAHSDILDNLSIQFNTLGSQEGSKTTFYSIYNWSGGFSSGIFYLNDYKSEFSEIDSMTNSLIASKTTFSSFGITPLKYRFRLNDQFYFDFGARYEYKQEYLLERGNFTLSSNIQIFNNEIDVSIHKPILFMSVDLNFNPIKIQYFNEFAPWYGYYYSQTMRIEPLLATTGTNSFSEDGKLSMKHGLAIDFFDIFKFEIQHEYERFNYNTLQLVYNGSDYDYTTVSSSYTKNCLYLIGSLLIDIEKVKIQIGLGRKMEYLIIENTGDTSMDASWVFNFGVLLN